MKRNREGVYSIGVVKELCGLTERQIRYYDEKGLVCPQRTRGGQRLYSPQDIERFKEIKHLLKNGYTIAEIKEYFSLKEQQEKQKYQSAEGFLGQNVDWKEPEMFFERRRIFKEKVARRKSDLLNDQESKNKKLLAGLPSFDTPRHKLRSVYPLSNQAELFRSLKRNNKGRE